MRRIVSVLGFLFASGFALGQCQTGPSGGTDNLCGGGSGGYYPETQTCYLGTVWEYAPGATNMWIPSLGGQYVWVVANDGNNWGPFAEFNGIRLYFYNAQYTLVFENGRYLGVLDAYDPNSVFAIAAASNDDPSCNFWCKVKQFAKDVYQDLWDAMHTGASHQCNQATLQLEGDALLQVGSILGFAAAPNWATGAAVVTAFQRINADYDKYARDCPH